MTPVLTHLRNLPVGRKLTVVILLTCSTVLVLAFVALFVIQTVTIKLNFVRDLAAVGNIMANNAAAAVAFNDGDSAAKTLSGLHGRSDIEAACIVLASGEHVSQFDLEGKHNEADEAGLVDGHRFIGSDVLTASPVVLDDKRLGTLYLRADFRPTRANLLELYGSTLSVVLCVSLLVLVVLANWFQRLVNGPILHLAEVVDNVAKYGDYSLRAQKTSGDEVGLLTDAFNDMLSQIQQRDCALQSARDELEKRVEERTKALANSVSLLNATLDSTADGILAVQSTGSVLCYNTQFATMWRVPQDVLLERRSKAVRSFLVSQVKNPEVYLERIQTLMDKPETEGFDLLELKDGRVFERYVKPQRLDGKSVGAVINFRDVTDRKRAERDLEVAHKDLLDTSRRAGMAEVATSVLHNIGNVLNSVNVSCSMIADKVFKSRISSVAKTADVLQEHATDLGAFFATDPVGQKLPDFLRKLSQRLGEERDSILAELKSLTQNIEHIKDIVAVQQSYANVGGVRETIPVIGLLEDAMRMNGEAMTRHSIDVVRDFQEVPPVPLEKHKVLQILVNLIRNAKHALTDSNRSDKRMVLGIARHNGHVAVSVSDNGIGIAQENITRIFAHGFTTKADGHGFGLHSGVLAAQEMGGRLSVHSDGPGTGATFTLELPIAPDGNP